MGCSKGGCAVIPDARVDISISQGTHINLSVHGNYNYYYDQGYAGVVVINNRDQLLAFDLCSSINPSEGNKVEVVENAYFWDSASGARWLLDGSPADVANCPLKGYAVSTSNNGFTYSIKY